jgi:hypothetical protein
MRPNLSPRTDREGMPSTRNSAEHFANGAEIVNDEAMWTTTPLPIWQLRAARQARNEAELTPFDWRLHRFHEAERLSLPMPPWRRDAALRAVLRNPGPYTDLSRPCRNTAELEQDIELQNTQPPTELIIAKIPLPDSR